MTSKPVKVFVLPLLVALVIGLYLYGAFRQSVHVNVDMVNVDQSAYMNYGRKLRESGYTHVGNRNRMPVYPLILSLIYRPGMDDGTFFFKGKVFNVTLSLVILAGLFWVFTRSMSKFLAVNLILAIAFGVFMYKAGYVQAELLFYGINFLLFVLMLRMLQSARPTFKAALGVGVVGGIAHLTKASILPGLLLFSGFGLLKWGTHLWQHRRELGGDMESVRSLVSPILAFVLVGITFLVTVSPYIITSKRVFGRYFYNVNSTFYMWYESWEEASEGTKAHGDRHGWPDMPSSEIPSMGKYLREHTVKQILWRFYDGGMRTWESVRDSYGYHIYVFIYGGLLIPALIASRRKIAHLVQGDAYPYIFVAAYFVSYGLLYAWYAWITWGNRFVLAQFAPLLFVLGLGLDRWLRSIRVSVKRRPVIDLPALFVVNLFMAGFTLCHILTVLIANIESISGAA